MPLTHALSDSAQPPPREEPREPAFASRGPNVYQAGEVIAQARSNTLACRIANALNAYQPDRRGK